MSEYAKAKLKILKHFGIKISDSDKMHLQRLKTEIAIDNWGRTMILNWLS